MTAAARLLLLALAATAALAAPAQEKYSSRFDKVDVDAILNNDRLLSSYIKCLLNDGDQGCTPEGKALKGVLREAIETNCARCTDAQVVIFGKVVPFFKNRRADDWKLLAVKYDPQGVWGKNHPDQ